MKKSDLKDRMVVEIDSGERFMVVGDRAMARDSYILLDDLNEDLSFTGTDNKGIQKVYAVIQTFNQKDIDGLLDLLWERPWKPEKGDIYYYPSLQGFDMYGSQQWLGDSGDKVSFERGLVFKSNLEAIECTKKLLEVIKNGSK